MMTNEGTAYYTCDTQSVVTGVFGSALFYTGAISDPSNWFQVNPGTLNRLDVLIAGWYQLQWSVQFNGVPDKTKWMTGNYFAPNHSLSQPCYAGLDTIGNPRTPRVGDQVTFYYNVGTNGIILSAAHTYASAQNFSGRLAMRRLGP